MAWFKKGGDDKPEGAATADAPAPAPTPGGDREHARFVGKGERLMILQDDSSPGTEHDVADLSEGGFRISGYEGSHKGNQYFEFKLSVIIDGTTRETTGFANVVRVKDGFLAAKFTPQARLKQFLRDYLLR